MLRNGLTVLLLPRVLFIYTTILRLNSQLALDRSINFDFKKVLPSSTSMQRSCDGRNRLVQGNGRLSTS